MREARANASIREAVEQAYPDLTAAAQSEEMVGFGMSCRILHVGCRLRALSALSGPAGTGRSNDGLSGDSPTDLVGIRMAGIRVGLARGCS